MRHWIGLLYVRFYRWFCGRWNLLWWIVLLFLSDRSPHNHRTFSDHDDTTRIDQSTIERHDSSCYRNWYHWMETTKITCRKSANNRDILKTTSFGRWITNSSNSTTTCHLSEKSATYWPAMWAAKTEQLPAGHESVQKNPAQGVGLHWGWRRGFWVWDEKTAQSLRVKVLQWKFKN